MILRRLYINASSLKIMPVNERRINIIELYLVKK